jgi:hypothetical protein
VLLRETILFALKNNNFIVFLRESRFVQQSYGDIIAQSYGDMVDGDHMKESNVPGGT